MDVGDAPVCCIVVVTNVRQPTRGLDSVVSFRRWSVMLQRHYSEQSCLTMDSRYGAVSRFPVAKGSLTEVSATL
jgi:hypothetical protein